MEIPSILLFRGDSDYSGQRFLKHTLHHGQLQTNLINGGNGRKIHETPIVDLVNKHVEIGF